MSDHKPTQRCIWIFRKKELLTQPAEPIEITRAGQTVDLYFLDTEGQSEELFALTLLLSSTVLFSSIGVLDETALTELSLMTGLPSKISVHRKPPPPKAELNDSFFLLSEVPQFMPDFCWILHDFQLELVNEKGRPIA